MPARDNLEIKKRHHESDLDLSFNYDCVCPVCGFKIPQEEEMPCYNKSCPRCGMLLTKTKC